MKVLLIGEFSGVHTNLKKGLVKLGHEVFFASDGDGYRNFTSDFPIAPSTKSGVLGVFCNLIHIIFNIRKLIGYDVVQFIFPFSIPSYYYQFGVFNIIKKFNKKIIYYACGSDPQFLTTESKFEYFPLDDTTSKDYPSFQTKHHKIFNEFMNAVALVVPSMYTYSFRGDNDFKKTSPIPLPGSGNIIDKDDLVINKRVKILFGISRRDFKGASFILDALKQIERDYKDCVEINIVEKIPFAQYIKLLKESDILIDQCKSYDYAMNAIFAMEKGTIVLSGAEKDALNYLGIKKCPVINIKPNTKDIYAKIEQVINNSHEIPLMKEKIIEYVAEIHNPLLIAEKFENLY